MAHLVCESTVKLGAAEHLPLDELQPGDVAFVNGLWILPSFWKTCVWRHMKARPLARRARPSDGRVPKKGRHSVQIFILRR